MRSLLATLAVILMVAAAGFALYAGSIDGYVGHIVFFGFFETVVLFSWSFCDKKIRAEKRRKKATRTFEVFKKEIAELRTELVSIQYDSSDPLRLLVRFFNLISYWHDKDLTELMTTIREANTDKQYDDVFNHLTALQIRFRNAGRDEYGMNRTKKGEVVTTNKVFLGNIYGLFTLPISDWDKCKHERKGLWKGGNWDGHPDVENRNAYDVVSMQAQRFMRSHVSPMVNLIESLQQATL